MKHTPGEWRNDNTGEYYNGHWIRMNGVLIAKISHQKGGKSKGEPEANARLIAAAPDLLEALKRLTKFVIMIEDVAFSPAVVNAKIAIQKAEEK